AAPTQDAYSPIRLDVETLAAGTHLRGQIRLTYATSMEYAFLDEILAAFAAAGHLGGRRAAGYGHVRADVACAITAGTPDPECDWRSSTVQNRDAAIRILSTLS
ncbi:hypothetical protein GOEFS_109_00170, partial [Gordonia effusa NBRC 100432]